MSEQKPSICRIVQFNDDPYPSWQDSPEPDPDTWIAALVVAVHSDEEVNLVTWDEFWESTHPHFGRVRHRPPSMAVAAAGLVRLSVVDLGDRPGSH